MREKQVQQVMRPVISIHKWFARRPGSVFRSLLLAEFGQDAVADAYWQEHSLSKVVADPFMGGGTTVYESLRLGCSVVAGDINPMSAWLVREAVAHVDVRAVRAAGLEVWEALRSQTRDLYVTTCRTCAQPADVKYFLWVKTVDCPACASQVVLQPNLRIAQAVRHTHEVYLCPTCVSVAEIAPGDHPTCQSCRRDLGVGTTARSKATCPHCQHTFPYAPEVAQPPEHVLVCLEYHCADCYPTLKGRQFKSPDQADRRRVADAMARFQGAELHLPIPDDVIPPGDETGRLLRWGYKRYSDLFSDRQLLSLGTLASIIVNVEDKRVRYALATVFSDFLRYQNLLCRYDVYALKCQDVFAVHGFPVGLSACENNVAGIRGVGSGSFVHFLEKYCAAKEYTQNPYEIQYDGKRKTVVPTPSHPIEAPLTTDPSALHTGRAALIEARPGQEHQLPAASLDAVLTDPPYYANVQYSELMDFCFVWLRQLINDDPTLAGNTTRHASEATGNTTQGRGLAEFTQAMSDVYTTMAGALKPGGMFAFTYHHNDPAAYAPLMVAILDAGLTCTDVLPAPAEMAASIHINNTKSSILDSVFICRAVATVGQALPPSVAGLTTNGLVQRDIDGIRQSGYAPTPGDVACLTAGHVAAQAIRRLAAGWSATLPIDERLRVARDAMSPQLTL
jgi:adenine-specific DNA methylase